MLHTTPRSCESRILFPVHSGVWLPLAGFRPSVPVLAPEHVRADAKHERDPRIPSAAHDTAGPVCLASPQAECVEGALRSFILVVLCRDEVGSFRALVLVSGQLGTQRDLRLFCHNTGGLGKEVSLDSDSVRFRELPPSQLSVRYRERLSVICTPCHCY